MTAPVADPRLGKGQLILALVLLALAWAGTAVWTLLAIECCAGRSYGLEAQYLLIVTVPAWAAVVITAVNCAFLYRWRWPWVLYGALAIGAPAFVFLRGCVAFARWWLS